MGLSTGTPPFIKQIDTFTGAGNGTTIDVSTNPFSKFTIVVSATGTITSWTVILEGSIDAINFTTIATHTNLIGNNISIFSGVNLTPCLYFRTKCTALVLGIGTNIVSTVLGA